MELRTKTHAWLMQSARGHCRGGESIASPPKIPVAWDAHDLSDASKPPHRKLCWQFDPQVQICGAQFHGSHKNQHDFDFWFAFPWFFRSRRIFLFPLSALRLQLDVVLVDPRFVTCDDLFQEFNASSEVFQSTQRSLIDLNFDNARKRDPQKTNTQSLAFS